MQNKKKNLFDLPFNFKQKQKNCCLQRTLLKHSTEQTYKLIIWQVSLFNRKKCQILKLWTLSETCKQCPMQKKKLRSIWHSISNENKKLLLTKDIEIFQQTNTEDNHLVGFSFQSEKMPNLFQFQSLTLSKIVRLAEKRYLSEVDVSSKLADNLKEELAFFSACVAH